MAQDTDVATFLQRFRDLQVNQDTTHSLINDILKYCERTETSYTEENQRLTKELDALRLDLLDATKSRRDLQQQVHIYENEFYRFKQNHVRNPYVAIIIDGDGLIFQDQFVKAGVEGGKKAALALRNTVGEQCNEMEICVKIVAGFSGLSKAMARDGAIEHWTDLKDFTLGFTQAEAEFDFIDVGCDSESARRKIIDSTKWHLQNNNCQQVLVGISHEASYAPFLTEILMDETTRKRVTVLEGVPTVPELVSTGVNIFSIGDSLFRNTNLSDGVMASPAETSPNLHVAPPALTPPASTSTASPFSSYADMAQKVKPASPPPQITMPLAPKAVSTTTRAKSSPQPLPPTPAQTSTTPKWNPGPRGFDEPIDVNQTILETVKKRKDSNKLCNNHFLRGPCTKGDNCTFVHKYKPTPDEIDAIAFLTRLNPCTLGQECEADDCIYGHHCPSVKDGTCTHPFCKFPISSHPPGIKYKNAHIDKN